jgi:hypothetical protein
MLGEGKWFALGLAVHVMNGRNGSEYATKVVKAAEKGPE